MHLMRFEMYANCCSTIDSKHKCRILHRQPSERQSAILIGLGHNCRVCYANFHSCPNSETHRRTCRALRNFMQVRIIRHLCSPMTHAMCVQQSRQHITSNAPQCSSRCCPCCVRCCHTCCGTSARQSMPAIPSTVKCENKIGWQIFTLDACEYGPCM